MKTFEIYFSDLNEEAQAKLLELVGVETPDEMNWSVRPIAYGLYYDFEDIDDEDFEDDDEV